MTLHYPDVSKDAGFPATAAEPAVQTRGSRLYRGAPKRALDLLLTVVSAIVWVPVMALFALIVALDGHSPFYVQKRVGRGGRVFSLLKLRTMVPDAERQLQKHLEENPAARREWDHSQKLKSDPRITRIGQVLRATSMDELPQLINVLKGDMSLVGPRPFMESQKPLYPRAGYYRLRPGLTGLWQVSDRNNTSFVERARLDDEYERTISLGTDLSILARTVRSVLFCTGY